ncbi:hypothetical protein QR98_0067730 [Sarcoptes scabiei]|uniref:Uncharacterized protein n=1 Tax=Sarcoptes scabiei TaxID=52283 RepID=A0A132ABG6_SARSC|nr:hypothetical protein QR98_0067730 [Sarcoptes scabiei]
MDQDEIYTTNSQFRMGLKEAINLTGELNLPMIVGEKMIMNWIYEHWFCQINTGTITLGPRVLAEKADYLEQKHHLPKCSECYIICLGGHKCPDCLKFIHESCSDSLQKCIDCRTDLLLNQKFNSIFIANLNMQKDAIEIGIFRSDIIKNMFDHFGADT